MAIFGNLEHHSLTDLSRMLGGQIGSLHLYEAVQGKTLELFVVQGQVCAAYLDGFPLDERGVRDAMSALGAQPRGEYEFQPRTKIPTPGFVAFALLELAQMDGWQAAVPEDQLPHPQTRFVASVGVTAPASLAATWRRVEPFLVRGSNALELSTHLNHALRPTQETLHHLRAVGLIAPLRSGAGAGAAVSPTAVPAAPALVQRLLGALRRFAGARS